MTRFPSPNRPQARTPKEIALDATLTSTHKIELLTKLKDHNAAPWQQAVVREADVELAKLLRPDQ